MILLPLLFYVAVADPTKVACVGDSITWGYGTPNHLTDSYPAQLQKMLGAGYLVGNFGHSGATLSNEGPLPYWDQKELEAAEKFQPEVVVIMLGTNDAAPTVWEKVRDNFVPEYKELIKTFRALDSHPKVFVALAPASFGNRQFHVETGINPLIKQVARESNTPLIDMFAPLDGRKDLFPDQLHPNQVGQAMLAQEVYETISNPANHKRNWKVVAVDSEETDEGPAQNAIDGDISTYWHTNYSSHQTRHPHQIVVDLGEEQMLTAFKHWPRQDGGVNGRVKAYELYLSLDGEHWGEPVLKGTLPDTMDATRVAFKEAVKARYFKFVALSEVQGGPWTSVGELDVIRMAP